MENLEIILEDVRKDELCKLVFNEFKITSSEVKDSHFFNRNTKADIEFHELESLWDVFSPVGTGNVLLNQLDLGFSLKNVLIIFSFDKELGNITINFSESELFEGENSSVRLKAQKILESLLILKHKFNIPKIRIGFEPASDDDMCLLEIGYEAVDLESAVDLLLR
ncbi:hypothetical protein ACH6EH_09450 [Paenibacillus sp. JSM ZJ436]|uniref:hypothetical protein n=1 Tax=Paenibacillus sp. JSM ZJ436 TaxID=3376190 RepID=UPI0037B83A1F